MDRTDSIDILRRTRRPKNDVSTQFNVSRIPSKVLSCYSSSYGRIVEDIYGFYSKPEPPPDESETFEVEPFSMGEGEYEPAEQQVSFGTQVDTEGEGEELPEDPRRIEELVKRYTLSNTRGMTVQVINYGATVISIRLLDKDGVEDDVVLGFDDIDGYISPENQYFGGTIGRVSDIIQDAVFRAGKRDIYLTTNQGLNHYHGGFEGFDKVLWDSYINNGKVVMTHVSNDREEGYPGNVLVQMAFSLTCNNQFVVEITASPSKPTPISITPHIYFNLAGHGTGPDGMKEHCIMVNADRFVLTDLETGIPTGEIVDVGGSYYDLRVPRPLNKIFGSVPNGGYDHTFCLSKGAMKRGLTFAVRLVHPPSGRFLEVLTDNPGLHIYTADRLPNPDRPVDPNLIPVLGKDMFLITDLDEYDREYVVDKVKQWPEDGVWPRPPSEPSEEHVFPTYSQMMAKMGKEGEWEKPWPCEGEEEEEGECIPSMYSESDSWIPPKEIDGKMGCTYRNHGGICLMPQEYPNSVNIKHFPRPVVYPGKGYQRTIVYSFGIVHQRKPDLSLILERIPGEPPNV